MYCVLPFLLFENSFREGCFAESRYYGNVVDYSLLLNFVAADPASLTVPRVILTLWSAHVPWFCFDNGREYGYGEQS